MAAGGAWSPNAGIFDPRAMISSVRSVDLSTKGKNSFWSSFKIRPECLHYKILTLAQLRGKTAFPETEDFTGEDFLITHPLRTSVSHAKPC
jgi:hypothetical protein